MKPTSHQCSHTSLEVDANTRHLGVVEAWVYLHFDVTSCHISISLHSHSLILRNLGLATDFHTAPGYDEITATRMPWACAEAVDMHLAGLVYISFPGSVLCRVHVLWKSLLSGLMQCTEPLECYRTALVCLHHLA